MGNILVTQVHRRPLAALLLICVLAWLPGFFTLPPLDRDESRFAQATKQMLETGDYIDISLGGVPRYEKPVGIYWLQAASTAALGSGTLNQIWTYRIHRCWARSPPSPRHFSSFVCSLVWRPRLPRASCSA